MLKKDITYKGLPITAFYKITSVNIVETWSDEQGKLYTAKVLVNSYTDNSKEFDIEQKDYEFKDIRENQFTLSDCYLWLKSLEEFNLAVDC